MISKKHCSRCKGLLEKERVKLTRLPICLKCRKLKEKIRYILKTNGQRKKNKIIV